MLFFAKRYIGRSYNGYHILRLIGQGRYGACFEADAPDGDQVVLKRFHNRMRKKTQSNNHFEPVILSTLSHPSVPSLLGVINAGKDYFFVLEKMPGTSIETLLFSDHYCFSQEEVYRIGLDLIDVISYLHENNIAHRDIRPANVLWDQNRLSLIDFGLARFADGEKYRLNSDFSYLGDFLLYLLYSTYCGKSARKKPWYEELSLRPEQVLFLKRLFGIEKPYDTIEQIRVGFQQVFPPAC